MPAPLRPRARCPLCEWQSARQRDRANARRSIRRHFMFEHDVASDRAEAAAAVIFPYYAPRRVHYVRLQ